MKPAARSAFVTLVFVAASAVACGSGGPARLDAGATDAGLADGGPRDGGGVLDAGIDDGGAIADGGANATDGGMTSPDGGAVDAGAPCPRVEPPADRVRKVVVSHPYDAMGRPARRYEVMDLLATGDLARGSPPVTFEMARAFEGDIAFTPDGEVGITSQDDGSLGVFRFEGGAPHVVHAAFKDGFYASGVVVAPDGQTAYVLDSNFPENGGGLYRARIACDGTLTSLGRWAVGKGPRALADLAGGDRLVAARELLDSRAGDDVHRLAAGEVAARRTGADAFGDDEAIVASLALTANGRHALVGDNNQFSGLPNRIAVVALADGGVAPVQVLSPINDPVAILASPFDDAVLVASGFGNALLRLRYDPSAATPFTNMGPIVYRGARPQLPANAVMIRRGALRGRVLVSENLGVRQVQFGGDGGVVTDLGLTSTGSSLDAIVGIVGVQP